MGKPVADQKREKVMEHLVLSGQLDACFYTQETALVIDWKTGFSEPDPAEQNSQMKVLAVLVALHLPSVQEVIVQVISGPFGVSEARYDRVALAAAWDDIMATLRKINDPHAPLTPGVEQCRYCPAAAICQPCRDLLSPPTKFQTTTLPDDPDRAAKLLDEITILEGVFEEVKKYYAGRLTTDPAYRIPGWNMAPGPQRREVANWKAARVRLEEFVGTEELDQLANYSIPSVEKLIAKVLKLKGKEASIKLAEILGELLTVRPGSPCLKRVKGEAAKLVTLELP